MDLSHFQKDTLTIGECYRPAMAIESQEDANAYLDALVQYCMRKEPGVSRVAAEQIQRSNLGYFAGYYDNKTRVRVERLFHCQHPIFGAAAAGAPSVQQALAEGIKRGSAQ